MSSVRERYTTVKRLVVRPAPSRGNDTFDPNFQNHVQQHLTRNVLVEVQFTGPQPSEGPGALLCDLLCGMTVEAQPVELPRGRKKRTRTDTASSEASDSGKKYLHEHNDNNHAKHHEIRSHVVISRSECHYVNSFCLAPFRLSLGSGCA